MKQILISVPDKSYESLLAYVSNIPNVVLQENNFDFELTAEQMLFLDKSSSTPIADCLTGKESINLIRNRSNV